MNEKLLQFIWQFQYFNKSNLITVEGLLLQIITVGQLNTNQGPDFLNSKIKIDNTIWAGNIEIHIQSSQWHDHHHTEDKNYSNVILHVVWENDINVKNNNGENIATLELQSLVPKIMLQVYEQLMNAKGFVPCENYLPALSEMGWLSWKERLIAERLQQKSGYILELLRQPNNHWEEVFWWLLARNFGIKVNADVFEQVAKSIPVNILAKHKNQVNQLEALLFGQAGLLGADFKDDYPKLLQREYRFLAAKYKLKTVSKTPDFLRMRPANFPTIRLAQLAMLIFQSSHLFSRVLEIKDINELKKLLDITANDYWHYHYMPDVATDYKPKKLGSAMVDNIIINTIVPVLFAYGSDHKEQQYKELAIKYLMHLPAEVNTITKQWKSRHVLNENAFDSQALIELKNNFCNNKLCLNCAVGNKILKREA